MGDLAHISIQQKRLQHTCEPPEPSFYLLFDDSLRFLLLVKLFMRLFKIKVFVRHRDVGRDYGGGAPTTAPHRGTTAAAPARGGRVTSVATARGVAPTCRGCGGSCSVVAPSGVGVADWPGRGATEQWGYSTAYEISALSTGERGRGWINTTGTHRTSRRRYTQLGHSKATL